MPARDTSSRIASDRTAVRSPGPADGGFPDRAVRAAVVAVGVLLFAAATTTSADPDLWGHLRIGLDALDTGPAPAQYPYAFTQDKPWLNHEWLSQIVMALAYRAGGIAGLALLKGALVFGALYLVWSASRGADLMVRMAVMGVAVVGTGSMTLTLRPQLWTLLFVGILCRVLVAEASRIRFWLPAMFGVWANLHGGWIAGIAMLGAWAAADVIANRRGFFAWTALVLACSAPRSRRRTASACGASCWSRFDSRATFKTGSPSGRCP